MKSISTVLLFSLVVSATCFAQTISITDGDVCYIGPDVVTLVGNDGGSPSRNIYTGMANNGSIPMRVIWVNSQWEIQLDTDANGSYETPTHGNTFASAPNPPTLGTGVWSDLTGGVCQTINEFQGTGTQTTLPIELVSFEAKQRGKEIILNWTTESEISNEKFEIELSYAGRGFQKIGEVTGAGTTTVSQNYSFLPDNPQNGTSYFRLKQVDFDGQFSYSEVVSLDFNGESGRVGAFYPNPSRSGFVNLKYFTPDEDRITVSVFNVAGRLVANYTLSVSGGSNNLSFDFSELSAGLHTVWITDKRNQTHRSLIIGQ
ncbi:T9SS type A sorting domain-containing protein [Neolewinella aurantiaca]|uniref:T9SS type A sorting domain-containing protein n=1 Tax=Neolewinella aurantiaca TaxID=2602767 RepID=A0A5C7FD33_9BACT|nr:T9SS type A sorting domain-containing protein [Neolewinella aurantiaca]TXF82574.1 T9SS type A sorting domain-containing protein [Neolewinella aurantiaca]